MRRILTIVVISSFIAVLFGSLFMTAHGDSHGFICLATRLNGSEAPCPQSDPLGFAGFHNDALKKISNLIIVDGVGAFYLAVFSILLMFGVLSISNPNGLLFSGINLFESRLLTTSYLPPATLSWLALHEKCDPASVF